MLRAVWERRAGEALNTRVAIVVAAVLAGAASLAGGEPLVSGSSRVAAQEPAASFAERFYPATATADCTRRNWPYIGAECLRSPDGSRIRPARVITVDRQIPAR